MNIPFRLPLDDDGFLRRECPSCEQEFKWFHHEAGDVDAEPVDHYYCPRCGAAAGPDAWWTPLQLKSAKAQAAPEIERTINDALGGLGRASRGLVHITSSFEINAEDPGELDEPNDMVIIEPPCHPNEPVKVPEVALGRVYCLVCGEPFSA